MIKYLKSTFQWNPISYQLEQNHTPVDRISHHALLCSAVLAPSPKSLWPCCPLSRLWGRIWWFRGSPLRCPASWRPNPGLGPREFLAGSENYGEKSRKFTCGSTEEKVHVSRESRNLKSTCSNNEERINASSRSDLNITGKTPPENLLVEHRRESRQRK